MTGSRRLAFAICIVGLMAGGLHAQWAQSSLTAGMAGMQYGISGNDVFAPISGAGRGVYKSTDHGATWTNMASGEMTTLNKSITAVAVIDSKIFAHGSGVLFTSTDNAATWTVIGGMPTTCAGFKKIGSDIFAAMGSIYKSSDAGATWSRAASGATGGNQWVVHNGIIFASTGTGNGHSVYVSKDTGTTFVGSNIGTGKLVTAFAGIGTKFYYASDSLYETSDTGATWRAVSTPLSPWSITSLVTTGGSLFAGTFGAGVFVSHDSGRSWTAANQSLTDLNVNTLGTDGTNLFAGTMRTITASSGIWYRPISQMTGVRTPHSGGLIHKKMPVVRQHANSSGITLEFGNGAVATYELINCSGKLAARHHFTKSTEIALPTKGVYLLRISDKESAYTQKVVVR